MHINGSLYCGTQAYNIVWQLIIYNVAKMQSLSCTLNCFTAFIDQRETIIELERLG